MAPQLLNLFAWIQHVHSDTLELVDPFVFQCMTCAWDPTSIPTCKDVWIMEPPSIPNEDPPGKKSLIYPIRISVRVCARQAEASFDLDSVDGPDSDEDRYRWHRLDHDGLRSQSHSPMRGWSRS
jgi:hypothetical protein